MDTTAEPQLTAEAEAIVSACPGCGRELTREIPAGTVVSIADLMRKVVLTCAACAEREDAEAQARKAAQERARRVDAAELPPVLRGLAWESYNTDRRGARLALRAAQEWAAGTHAKRGLVFVGPVGVGKTRLAATAAWAALDRIGVRYVNVADLIVKLSGSFADRDRSRALQILTGRGPIVLDDVDKVRPSMTVLAHLYTAVENRVQAAAPVLVTTNLQPDQLRAKFATPSPNDDPEERRVMAESIVSRLVGHCTWLAIEGEDARR